MQVVARNPRGLFEMRLARERQRIRAETTHLTRPISPSIYSHIPAVILEQFVDAVRQFDAEPVLRYSQRLSLLKLAATLGIRRFDANLVIASIERERKLPPPEVAGRHWANAVAWSVAGLLQGMIVAGAWWIVSI